MAKKSSFLLAVLFIANPFVLLFYQNCSKAPHPKTAETKIAPPYKSPASETH
ncbi:MAG: hypothetical protein ACK4VO_04840 [Pseudobdellovibrio sp.]